MKYELEPVQFAVRVYDDDEHKYIAAGNIFKCGESAYIFGASSPRLFQALAGNFEKVMKELGVKYFEGYMTDAMARALRMATRTFAKLEVYERGLCSGRMLSRVKLSKLRGDQ